MKCVLHVKIPGISTLLALPCTLSTVKSRNKGSNLKPSDPFKGHFKRHRRPQGILPCKKKVVSFLALQ